MNITKKRIVILFTLILTLFVLIAIINKLLSCYTSNKEPFLNKFQEMYRPRIRNIRLISENYYKKIKNNTVLFFRKFGLI
jgi:hypothetical protein